MARISKKAKAVALATVEDVAADVETRSVGEAGVNAVADLPAQEPDVIAFDAENVADVETIPTDTAPEAAADVAAAADTASEAVTGGEVFIPLNKLKKSPRNARKTPHSQETIEAYAASIAAKGILQNLVVEPEYDPDAQPTGFYFVTIGEGRRLAQLLRVKRKEIRKTEAVRCIIDTANDPFEISLDENVNRAAMHPADQFEAFRELAENRGWGAEEIAARFGVSAHVVRQRLRLGAVSPKLMQIYREGGLKLDQLQAFAITDDHARQEQVYAGLGYNREPHIIRRDLTHTHIHASDRKAIFVGAEAYTQAGGYIVRDLFTDDRGGYFEDAALLDRLVIEKLEGIAADVQAEGWKWANASIDFPYAHGFRRVYPALVDLSDEDEAAYIAAQEEHERLAEVLGSVDEYAPDDETRFMELEAEMKRLDSMRDAYEPDALARGGVFVSLNHDGTARIERGFIRPEDEVPEPEDDGNADGETLVDGVRVNEDGEIIEDDFSPDPDSEADDSEEEGRPISDGLVRDLTAHRTLGLRLALGEQPEIALIAVTHALAAQTFYRGKEAQALDIRPYNPPLGAHADGIEDTAAAKLLSDRHDGWAADVPQGVADLWGFIAGLDQVSVMALLAHCASLTVSAVKLPWDHKPRALETADKLATALALDMSQQWTPTVRTYLGRITKAHILAAVGEALGDETAERLSGMKKVQMAEAAEQLLAGTGWLPPLLRTEQPASPAAPQAEADAETAAEAAADGASEARKPDAGEPTSAENPNAAEDAPVFHDAAE
ncbi:ParB/Srx family N-terminal domain-containing protein [Rhizobium sp. LC145]|uniref:ParB/RepB/Spo0J family partition protein n=1 Tax=Rhizobium sp. LC145 TaxID=1120688 RepID=UPI000629F200|nr:ParB/Srx family N-terminal domain-containing protein [Rhizobium sp. LC145]KKX29423.1 plasmid stablization protein ParB [Rhizobium sp. LC145]MDX3927962.1 ParB/Srx family N-terminal domain-containing protein [Shinella sp.]TKT69041.1 ParB/RepB/Spo0J family partition protein [Rhizobiaceae bacterium LC148]